MKDGADGDDLGVVVDTFQMSNLHCEQPRSHRVIEKIRLGELSRVFQRLGDKRRVRDADACYQTSAQNFAASLSRALSPIGRSHIDVNRIGHLSSLLPSSGCPDKSNESARDRAHVNRLTNSSAFTATSLQPASIVSACPRPGILTISVTLLLCFCFL